ncbi:MAG: M48 family metallopeptidase [Dehalococcoidia bacterium]
MRRSTPREAPSAFQLQCRDQSITCTIVRSKRRRKTISISVSAETGVRIAAPVTTSESFIRELVTKRSTWILKRLAAEATASPSPRQFVSGERLPYLGVDYPLLVSPGGHTRRVSVAFNGDTFGLVLPETLEGSARENAFRKALTAWYRERAQSAVARSVSYWSARMNLASRAVLVRDQRRRWGSCSPDGTLRINWRLVLAPPDILDYVVVHELAHLAQRNHSPAFWAVVAEFLPDHKVRRKWLREHGPRLAI